jgi:hypothetical protein
LVQFWGDFGKISLICLLKSSKSDEWLANLPAAQGNKKTLPLNKP